MNDNVSPIQIEVADLARRIAEAEAELKEATRLHNRELAKLGIMIFSMGVLTGVLAQKIATSFGIAL